MSAAPSRWGRLGRLMGLGGLSCGLSRGVWAALAALMVVLTVAYVRHPEGRFTRAGRAHGDGVYYYVYLRSLVYDRDLDFENDYALLGNPHHRPVGKYGLRENRFAIGAGLLWLPTFAVATATTAGSNALGWTDEPQDGTGAQTQRITLFASVLHAALAALLITLLARRYVATWIACAAGIAVVMATPLWWYAVYQPSWPHAASACVGAAFVLAWERGREGRSTRGWFWLGALLGLVALVRAQDVVFGLLPAGSLAALLWRGPNPARREALRGGLLFAAGAALAFAPQMIAWWQIYGSPLTIPQGEEFMQWSASKPGFTLFSSRNGLFSWSPIVSLSFVGIGLLALRRGTGRWLAIGLVLVFALEAFILGSTRDWWAGWAFGGRRYLGCSVIFGLGLAVLIDRVHGWTVRHSRLVLASLPALGIALFSLCNLSLTHDYLFAEVKRGEGQDMRPVYERAALRGVGAVFDTIGNPGAAPASWWFAWRAGVGAQRYDAASGIELTEPTGRPREQFIVWFDDPRIGMAGFGPRAEHAGERASVVAGPASFVLPMRRSVALQGRVRLAAVEGSASLGVEIAGVPVLVAAEVLPGWHSYDFEVPAEALGPGFNYAAVAQSGAIAWGSLQLWRGRRPADPWAVDASPP